jgi:exonuclease III
LTRLTPNEPGANVPWQERNPIQVDYLFASKALASRLDEVIEIPPEQWERYSDHRPIIAKFRARKP